DPDQQGGAEDAEEHPAAAERRHAVRGAVADARRFGELRVRRACDALPRQQLREEAPLEGAEARELRLEALVGEPVGSARPRSDRACGGGMEPERERADAR